jgi:hypothetical protein
MKKNTCLQCSSSNTDQADVMPGMGLVSRKAKRSSLLRHKMGATFRQAKVCMDCGCVTLFVDVEEYKGLKEA